MNTCSVACVWSAHTSRRVRSNEALNDAGVVAAAAAAAAAAAVVDDEDVSSLVASTRLPVSRLCSSLPLISLVSVLLLPQCSISGSHILPQLLSVSRASALETAMRL